MRFEIFKRPGLLGTRWYWRLRARNGEILCHSQAYRRKANARWTVDRIISEAYHGLEVKELD